MELLMFIIKKKKNVRIALHEKHPIVFIKQRKYKYNLHGKTGLLKNVNFK